ncbi:MAG: hypothetical protein CVU18_00650 [Betaproteobacteria bacterium HGW-Betaproteobacteria-12]|nr:MAG: hypothetical protein CVU18_00650 [Betaproteobacteria bacterium HGW-Betaproteobacteria-12]
MTRASFKHLLPFVLTALLPVLAQAAAAARLDFVNGEVRALSASGETRSLAKGSELQTGDTVLTGRDGRAQLRFTDGALVSLQPQSEYRLDNYRFAGQADGQERGFFSLLKGGLRTLTGLIGRANRDSYKVSTAVATIGIRGTEFTVTYLDPETIAIATGEGRIEVCNRAGCIIVASGEAAVVRGHDQLPQLTASRPRLDPAQPMLSDVRPPFVAGDAVRGMESGPDYSMQFASNATVPFGKDNLTAQFSGLDLLVQASDGTHSFSVGAGLAEAASRDGLIGWGRWSQARLEDASVLDNFHYVAGRLTPLSDITGLGDGTYTYTLANGGATTAIDINAGVQTLTAASLVANFSSSIMNLSLNLQLSGNANPFSETLSPTARSQTFVFDGLSDGQGGFGQAAGMFVGAGAPYVGITYQLQPYFGAKVTGSAALGR